MIPSHPGILAEVKGTLIKIFFIVFFLNLYNTIITYDRRKSNKQLAKGSEQRAKSNEQRVKSNEQRVKSNEQRAKSNKQRATSKICGSEICGRQALELFTWSILENVFLNITKQ